MKRQSFKYIFYMNFLFITVCAVLIFFSPTVQKNEIPASITTPIINTISYNSSLCQSASAAIITDAKSGAVLFEKNAHTPLPMASTTKIMTALCVIECAEPDTIIEVSENAASTEGSSIYLKKGEKISVLDLLYGLLLESGNDAATALAEGVFGTVEECVKYMNSRCHSLGLISTHFDNPHGLDSDSHYTTAYELSVITKEALKNELFRSIVGTKNYTTKGENPRFFSNHNRFLRLYDGSFGVKTGYTSKAGRCLVTSSKNGNEEYIAVTLSDPLDWQSHKDMHSFAKENFDICEIADSESFIIYHGFDEYYTNDDIFLTYSGKDNFSLTYLINLNKEQSFTEYSSNGAKLGSFRLYKAAANPQGSEE